MPQILMIDDDKVLSELLSTFLSGHGFDVRSTDNPHDAFALINQIKPELIILDVMMPQRDGFSVLQEIRSKKNIPVIMLTARGEAIDRILGLELGADDYISKPFEPRELIARIKAVLKRSIRRLEEKFQSGVITIDHQSRRAFASDIELDLTTMEYDLLYLLVSNPGRKFTRDELLTSLHETETESYGRAIDNLVNRLRRKIEIGADSSCIKTVWGTGYVYAEAKAKI